MIVGAAFCPHPPALIPQLGVGLAAELGPLRSASNAAVAEMGRLAPDCLVLLGAAQESRSFGPSAAGSLAGYGIDRAIGYGNSASDGGVGLPLSLTVGAWLLAESGITAPTLGFAFGTDAAAPAVRDELLAAVSAVPTSSTGATPRIALVVLGDGSARRTEKAPGYIDPRAGYFDAAVLRALRSGQPSQLAQLDPTLGAELLAAGVPAWSAAASALTGADYLAEVSYEDDPFGVWYAVATWLRRD